MQLVHHHGGDLDAIEREYGIPRNEIKDFSGNINPLGFPKSVEAQLAKNLDVISTYPDKNYFALREAIAVYTGANAKDIVVGNGSTELISAFIQTVNPKNSIIIGPAYSEYEQEVSLLGSSFSYFPLKEDDDFKTNITALIAALDDTVDMLVASNPNNPTGSAMTAKELRTV